MEGDEPRAPVLRPSRSLRRVRVVEHHHQRRPATGTPVPSADSSFVMHTKRRRPKKAAIDDSRLAAYALNAHLHGPVWTIPDIKRGRLTEEALSAAGALSSPLRQNVESVTSWRWWGSPSRSSSRHATDGS